MIALCAVALALRLLILREYLLNNPLAKSPQVDALTYWNWAGRIAAGQLRETTPFFSAPLYPYVLGAIRFLGGGLPSVYLVQIALDLATAGLLGAVGRRRFGDGVGLLSVVLFLALLEPVSFSLRALTSTLQLPLVCLAWMALTAADPRGRDGVDRSAPGYGPVRAATPGPVDATSRSETPVPVAASPRGGRCAVAGAALGALSLAYPPAMYGIPIAAAWLWWRGGFRAAAVGPALLTVAVGAVLIAPATIHNYLAGGGFFPIQAVVGVNFRQGNGPHATGVISMIPGTATDRENLFTSAQADFERRTGRAGTWSEIDRLYRDEALAYWRADPGRALRLFGVKAYWFLSAAHYGDIYMPTLERDSGLDRLFWLAPLPTAWLVPLALCAVAAWARRPGRHLVELLLLLIPLGVTIAFWYSPRYRYPALPVIAVGAAWMLAQAARPPVRSFRGAAAGAALAAALGLTALNRAIGFDAPRDFAAMFELGVGIARASQGDFAAATGHYDRSLAARPDFPAALVAKARALRELGRLDDALAAARRATSRSPEMAEAQNLLGMCLADRGELSAAIAAFETAVQRNPRSDQALNNLAKALADAGRFDEAIRRYEEALAVNPSFAVAALNLGQTLLGRGRAAEGERYLRQAVRLEPLLFEARAALAECLAQRGESAAALAVMREPVERHPKLPAARTALADWLEARGDYAGAAAALRAGLAALPESAELANNLAWLLATCPDARVRDGAEAVRWAQQAVGATGRGNASILGTLAAALAEAGRFGEAISTAQEAARRADASHEHSLAERLSERIRLFEKGRAYRVDGE